MQGHNRAGPSWDGPMIDNAVQETQKWMEMRLTFACHCSSQNIFCQLFAKILHPHLWVGEDGEGMEQGFSVAGQDLLFALIILILLSDLFLNTLLLLQYAYSSTSVRGRAPRKWSHGYFPKTISSLSHRRLNDGKKSGIPLQSTHYEERIIQNLGFLPKEAEFENL